MENLLALYKRHYGHAPQKVETLAKAGSNRQYVRLYADARHSVIGVIGPSREENRCFVYLANHFTDLGLPMPCIYAVSTDNSCYIQQDLGRYSLYDALAGARKRGYAYGPEEKVLLARTIRMLAHIQVCGARGLDFAKCLPPVKFDTQAAMFDLNYFKYSFLKTTDMPFDELRLEADMQRLAADLAEAGKGESGFLYRDFQARNVMLSENGDPYFIDFQGGMQGPVQYDVASFLWQASARYPQTFREELISEYVDEARLLQPHFDEEIFTQRLHLFVLFRILQVLGAYGLRGYVERKKYFLDSIPLAIQNLRRQLLDGIAMPYPYLEETLQRLTDLPQFNASPTHHGTASASPYDGQGPLVVRVFSFSYKAGIPEDTSGNGGGYVFDCRSTHNPGRYAQYKELTGLDAPVIKFLEEDGEILTFLDSVYKLADAHVLRYIQRGFTDLMFCFGCTGGRHRSVYSAQHLAEHLHQKFGIEVRICHREQNVASTLPPRPREDKSASSYQG